MHSSLYSAVFRRVGAVCMGIAARGYLMGIMSVPVDILGDTPQSAQQNACTHILAAACIRRLAIGLEHSHYQLIDQYFFNSIFLVVVYNFSVLVLRFVLYILLSDATNKGKGMKK